VGRLFCSTFFSAKKVEKERKLSKENIENKTDHKTVNQSTLKERTTKPLLPQKLL
jgi:hypothetical protein